MYVRPDQAIRPSPRIPEILKTIGRVAIGGSVSRVALHGKDYKILTRAGLINEYGTVSGTIVDQDSKKETPWTIQVYPVSAEHSKFAPSHYPQPKRTQP